MNRPYQLLILLLTMLCGWVLQLHAQAVQECLVMEYHGNHPKTALEGVSVTAANAGSVMSDKQGHMTLEFRSLKIGDQIQFRRIDMAGYELMNREAIEVARIARPSEESAQASTLQIVMAPRQLLRQLRDGYRSVAVQRYEKQLQEAEKEAERLRQDQALTEEQYNERMNQLEEEYENKLSQLETYIEKFARIDLSDLDADEQQIITLVQQGQFEEALALYDKQNLANRLRQSRADQTKLAEAGQQIAAAERQKALENQRLRQSIDRQVTLLRMAGGEENQRKVLQILHETFLADTTYWEARRVYALELDNQGQIAQSNQLLKTGIEMADDDFIRGFLTLELMTNHIRLANYEEGFICARQADSLLMPLQESNFQVLTRGLPAFSFVYLRYYQEAEDFKQCQEVVDRVRTLWSPDTLNISSLAAYLDMAENISEYYTRIGKTEQSLNLLEEALQLGEIMERKSPVHSFLYHAYAEASSVYAMAGKTVDAAHAVRRSMQLITERLERSCSKSMYQPFACDLFTMADALNLIDAHALCDSLMEMEQKYQIYATFNKANPQLSDVYRGCYLFSCIEAIIHTGDVAAAEQLYAEAVQRLESAGEDGAELLPQLQPGALARIRQAQGQYEEAERLYDEEIQYFANAYRESGDAWDADSECRYLLLLADMQGECGNRKACLKTLRQAERIAPFDIHRQKIGALKKKYK